MSPADPADLITFQAVSGSDPSADLEIEAQLAVSALLPGVSSGISLFDAGVRLSWSSINVADQIAVSAGINAGADVAEFLRFLEVGADDVLGQLKSLRDNIAALSAAGDELLGLEIPYVPAVLDDLVSAIDAFNDHIVDPILAISNGGSINTTAQQLVVLLANATGLDPSALQLAYDKLSDELTWQLIFDHSFVATPNLELDFDVANVAEITASADVQIAGTVSVAFTVGVDLGDLFGGAGLGDSFFLRDASVDVNASIDAAGINANARLGFLDVSVVGGGLHTNNLAFTLPFADPDGTNAGDVGDTDGGRVTLSELIANLATPGQLIGTPTLAGSLTAALPLAASIGSLSVPASAATTLTVTLPDLNDPTNVQVDPISFELQDLLNFKNMSAAGFVSLIGVLIDKLQDLGKSDLIADIDVPFVDGAVTTVLDFTESISDGLLYDDGPDNAKDGANRLATDLNDALANAGLASAFIVQGYGTHLVFEAIDRTITQFKVAVGGSDAGGFGQLAFMNPDTFGTSQQVTPPPNNGVNGLLTSNAGLAFTIQRTGQPDEVVEVKLTSDATTDNVGRGDDIIKLLRADNSATFDTAQGLAFRLNTILGLSNVVDYDPLTDALELNVGALLPKASIDKPFPIDFDVDLGPLLDVHSNTIVNLHADAGFDPGFVIGVYLGNTVPGAVSNLTTSTQLIDLNDGDGVVVETAPAITAPNSVDKIYGRLQNDAKFTLSYKIGAVTTVTDVTVPAAATSTNVSTNELVANINAALGVASSFVTAVADGNRVGLVAAPTVTEFSLSTTQNDPAVSELGFQMAQNAKGPLLGSSLDDFDLDIGDATFSLLFGGVQYDVTVAQSATTTNTLLTELASDVNNALANAKISGTATPANLSSKVMAEGVAGALRLKIVDASLFEVKITSQLDNPTVAELGLTDDGSFTRLLIAGTKDVPQVAGRLSTDTVLSFNVDGSPIPVTLYADDTATNTSMLSLVADINQALWVPTVKTDVLASFAPTGVAFKVGLNGGPLTDVTVAAALLSGNLTLSDLVKDLNDALSAVGLGKHVVAKPSGTSSSLGQARVKFDAKADSVTRLEITALSGNSLGLPTSKVATSLANRLVADSAGNKLVVSAVDSFMLAGGPAVNTFVLAADTSLTLVLSTAAGPGTPQTITVKKEIAPTTPNTRLEDLVADLNAALASKLDGVVCGRSRCRKYGHPPFA